MGNLRILQIGAIGDIIIVLPIAKWFSDRGFNVHWPVCSEYYPILKEHVPYVEASDIGAVGAFINHTNCIQRSLRLVDLYRETKATPFEGDTLDLSIGFSDSSMDASWRQTGFSFDKWKYHKAGVPFEEKYKLTFNRDLMKENALYQQVVKNPVYTVTHSSGSKGTCNFNAPGSVELIEIPGYTVFDWTMVLMQASSIFCVDSCIANLVNQHGIAKGRRHFKSFGQPAFLLPALAEDWITL